MRPGEPVEHAALREAREETGLARLRIVAFLGSQVYDMAAYRDEVQHRAVFQLAADHDVQEKWEHDERHDGLQSPTRFRFFWLPLDDPQLSELVAGQGELLPRLRWTPGQPITWREIWRGRVLGEVPMRVVRDSPDLLALYIEPGAPFAFPEPWPWSDSHPWAERGFWQGHGPLILHRPGDAYTVWAFWDGPERSFAGWYVNLEEPLRRLSDAVETFDHELDIWVEPNGSWQFKDEALLDACLAQGRFSKAEVERIRQTGAQVAAELRSGRRWWTDDWCSWHPKTLGRG